MKDISNYIIVIFDIWIPIEIQAQPSDWIIFSWFHTTLTTLVKLNDAMSENPIPNF